MVKKRFDLEKHKEVAMVLYHNNNYFVRLKGEISNAFPASTKVVKLAWKISYLLNQLNSELDEEMYKKHPDLGNDLIEIYYGADDDYRTGKKKIKKR